MMKENHLIWIDFVCDWSDSIFDGDCDCICGGNVMNLFHNVDIFCICIEPHEENEYYGYGFDSDVEDCDVGDVFVVRAAFE